MVTLIWSCTYEAIAVMYCISNQYFIGYNYNVIFMLLAVFTQFSPSDQELYNLRILLLHIPGATSYI